LEAEAVNNFRKMPASVSPSAARGNNMANAETPEIIRYLERHRYDSLEWSRGADIKSRGLGARIVNDPNVSTQKQDQVPDYGK